MFWTHLVTFCKFGRFEDTVTILKMTLLKTTLVKMTILITLYTGDITYDDITYNVNKCHIKYRFLSIVISKVICK
jgi:hypothetical protein